AAPGGAAGPVSAPRLPLAVLFGLLGVLAAAVQVLPSFEASRQSRRVEQTPAGLAAQALPTSALAGTVLAGLAGAPTDSTPPGSLPIPWWLTPPADAHRAETANQLEWNTFAGAGIVLLALTALLAAPRRAAFPALALLAVLAFACGWPGARILYRLPGLDLGAPSRVLSLAWILWPWLAAIGTDALVHGRGRAAEIFLLASFVFAAAAFTVWHGFDPARWAQQFEAAMVARYVEAPGATATLADVHARVPPAAALAAGEHLAGVFARAFAAGLAALLAAALAFLSDRRRPASEGAPRWFFAGGLAVIGAAALAPLGERGFAAELGPPAGLSALGAVL
ncbi:MAG: hypothetical protein AB1726_12890, partial [Planctomycetota bacterium]